MLHNNTAPSSSSDPAAAAFALSENGGANNKRKRRPAGTPGELNYSHNKFKQPLINSNFLLTFCLCVYI